MPLLNPSKKEYIRRWGVARTLYSLLMRILKKCVGFFLCVITIRPLNQDNPPSNPTPDIDYHLLTEKELLKYCNDPELEMTPSKVHTFISRGHLCAGGVKDGALITYVWRSYGPTEHTKDIWIDVNTNCRYGFKSLTIEAFRGQRLHSYLTLMTENSTRRDKTHAVGFIETHNFPSRHSSAFHGNKEIGYAGYIKLFGKYYTFHSPGAKKSGFRFFVKNKHSD